MPPEEKAEKLRIDAQTWDKFGQQFVLDMSCKFGLATAGEHADFKVHSDLSIVADGTTHNAAGETAVRKQPGAGKDVDGYIKIEPLKIAWDRGGFTGTANVSSSTSLIGPSGSAVGQPVIVTTDTKIDPPGGDVPGTPG